MPLGATRTVGQIFSPLWCPGICSKGARGASIAHLEICRVIVVVTRVKFVVLKSLAYQPVCYLIELFVIQVILKNLLYQRVCYIRVVMSGLLY